MGKVVRNGTRTRHDPCWAAHAVKVALILIGIVASVVAQGAQPYLGRPLEEVLEQLHAQGLKIVFSSELVRPDMAIKAEPQSDAPRAVLEEVLAPFGLATQDGPGGVVLVVAAAMRPTPAGGTIRGRVASSDERRPLDGATLLVEPGGSSQQVAAGTGSFEVSGLPSGTYTLVATAPGYSDQRLADISVEPGQIVDVSLELVPGAVFLSEMVVTPSRFAVLGSEPEARQFLSRDEIDRTPHLSEDLYRAVGRLPGTANGDISAKFHIRGGEQQEEQILLDGLELYNPFHINALQGPFSTVDSKIIGGVDYLSGGYPAEYGDRMSGVMEIASLTPSGPMQISVSASLINARVMAQGGFRNDRGLWLASARAWYPDRSRDLVYSGPEQAATDFFDLYGKVQYRFGDRNLLSGNLLASRAHFEFIEQEEDEDEEVHERQTSRYLWLGLMTDWSASVFSQTVLSFGRIDEDREGHILDPGRDVTVDDEMSFDVVELGQDWSYQASQHHYLKWGIDARWMDASYEYFNTAEFFDPRFVEAGSDAASREVSIETEPSGTLLGLYLSDRIWISSPLSLELGLRWDRQSHVDDDQLSPRVNLAYVFGTGSALRAAWGRFYQSQRLNELQVEDGVEEFFPAQLSEQWVVSLEHRLMDGLDLRADVYHKDLSRLRPRYENLFDQFNLLPEVAADRVRVAPTAAQSNGIEVFLKGAATARLDWWLGYTLASIEDEIDGDSVERSWDQRHAVTFSLNARLTQRWNINFAGILHSGWPTTGVSAEAVESPDGSLEIVPMVGPRNGERLPGYRRLDVRATYDIRVQRGAFTLFFEVFNVFNQRNLRGHEDFEFEMTDDGQVVIEGEEKYWLGAVPNVGFIWRF